MGIELKKKISQLIDLNQLTNRRFLSEGTPISTDRSHAWASSTSLRDGELRTCIKKFEDARITAATMLTDK